MMDRTGITFMLMAGLIVFGLFAFAGLDQTGMATAELQTDIALSRSPAIEKTAVNFGMALSAKVIAGVIVSLVIAIGIFVYQQARIRELKEGGWERFWERRKAESRGQKAMKKPSIETLMTMMLMRDIKNNDRNR